MFRRFLTFQLSPTLLYCQDGQQVCTPQCVTERLRDHHETLIRQARGVI
ncbi:MAG TPA: hypothetical protein VIN39_04750 [Candidatus Dormibacteraeota bacterium]|jgi:hypothetical protein